MRPPSAIALTSIILRTTALIILSFGSALTLGFIGPTAVLAQQAAAPPKAYKPVTITLPKTVADPSFDAFRKQISEIAGKKDRAALARIVAQKFFWIPEDKDIADARKPGIENLAAAIGLEGTDAPGWDLLAGYAQESTADPHPQQTGAICGPGEPGFDDKAAEELAKVTETEPAEWGYPANAGIDVRSGPEPTAPVMEKLGLYLVRVFPDDSPAAAVHGDSLRIVTPSGKLGYVPIDSVLPLISDQICYRKEGNAWRIAGAIGGVPPGK
jgi:hypothetical protein